MRFLADESCDFRVVRALRAAGHDVLAVIEHSPRADDGQVAKIASKARRILLTEDKNFGWLVFSRGKSLVGVILLRYPTDARREIVESFLDVVSLRGEMLFGSFVVLQPGKVRISRMPRLP